ncbi:hypothetical protein V502_04906 [Pseudogymnoascus sp. VKM F-4520 (FW-2644)]|nr:hypothetical protein V502_04906 [Pseudogymnoascus sp. VKM F-4520 (FW-2644)]
MGNDLASCPTWTPSEATSESYGHIIRAMKLPSFLKFGFVIYRCTYSDDAAWTQLLSLIKREAQEGIKKLGPGRDWLGAHLEWTVVEDPTLDGATQEEVKRRFGGWADGVVEEYERTSTGNVRRLPRFNYCVFVDEKGLASLEKSKAVVVLMRSERGIPAWVLEAQAAASRRPQSSVDSEDEEEENFEDEEEEEEEEDDIPLAAHEATWMYVETQYLLSLYNSLHAGSGWKHSYVRPPGVYGRNEV